MLEVVFDDSAKGGMKIAKNYKAKVSGACAVGFIGEGADKAEVKKCIEEQEKKQREGKPVGGDSRDVVNISFALDIGDISCEYNGAERRAIFQKMWGRFGFLNKEEEQFFDNQREDVEKLIFAANNRIPIRIWKSNAPYSMCGFYFVCHLLKDLDCEISVISLPEYWKTSESEIVTYRGWGEVDPGSLHQFLPLEKPISVAEKKMLADHWTSLTEENAPLRAVVNGRLISVPEDFYDHIIRKHIPEGEFGMAQLIGKILGLYNLGVSDSWYALRIEKMIEENKLIFFEDKDKTHPYAKVLKKESKR